MFHPSVKGDVVFLPGRAALAGEAAGVLRGVLTLPRLGLGRQPPRGDGGVVFVLPGYLTGDASTIALRSYLDAKGYRTRGWSLGRNQGDVEAYADTLTPEVRAAAQGAGKQVRIVGWSLGGVLGRELARRSPQSISHVVTIASPIVGGAKYTIAARSYPQDGKELDRIAARVARRNAEPMPVPVTAFYTKADSIVAWQACLDPNPASPTRHIEVAGKHSELGFSPLVLKLVALALAQGY